MNGQDFDYAGILEDEYEPPTVIKRTKTLKVMDNNQDESLPKFKSHQLENTFLKRFVDKIYVDNLEEQFTLNTITQKSIMLYRKYLKLLNTIMSVLIFINILLASVETEVYFNNMNVSTEETDTYRSINLIISFFLVLFVIGDYMLRLKIDKLTMKTPQNDSLCTSKKIYHLIVEVSICTICCPPGIDAKFSGTQLKGYYTYSIDAMIFLGQLCKSYRFLMLWIEYSMWTSQDAGAVCRRFRIKSKLWFALKSELKYRPVMFLGGLTIITILLLGQAVRTFERPFKSNPTQSAYTTGNYTNYSTSQQDLINFINDSYPDTPNSYSQMENFSDSWWLMIITMTTTGFGDIVPQTHTGRCICILASVIGQLVVSLLVVSLANASEFNQEESKAFHTIKKVQVSSKTKEHACDMIKLFLQIHDLQNKQDRNSITRKFLLNYRLRLEIIQFSKEFQSCQMDNLPLDEQLKHLNAQMHGNLSQIKKEVDRLHEFENRIERFLRSQKDTQENLNSILELQGKLQWDIAKRFEKRRSIKSTLS